MAGKIEHIGDYRAYVSEQCLPRLCRILAHEAYGGVDTAHGRMAIPGRHGGACASDADGVYAEMGRRIEETMAAWFTGCADAEIPRGEWAAFIRGRCGIDYAPANPPILEAAMALTPQDTPAAQGRVEVVQEPAPDLAADLDRAARRATGEPACAPVRNRSKEESNASR